MKKIRRFIYRILSFDKVSPVSRTFGFDRGKPVDRYYIEKFISSNKNFIYGDVLEVETSTYTKKFGNTSVKSFILKFDKTSKFESNLVYGDLTNKISIPSNKFDVFICTQTLNFIFEVEAAIESIFSLLKKNGVGLITVASLTQISRYDADRWGDFWRFTPQGIQKLFSDKFGEDCVELMVYGNSYSAIHLLKGFASDELSTKKLNEIDEDYPIVIALKITKK